MEYIILNTQLLDASDVNTYNCFTCNGFNCPNTFSAGGEGSPDGGK